MTPSWPERAACVPPHSSRAQSPDRDHPHLVAVLLAEQRHRADRAAPASCGMTSAVTARSSVEHVVDPCLDVGAAPPPAPPRCEAKSKRNRPGAFSEPACVAVSPSASRNALCTMCVAVWAREIAAAALEVDLAERRDARPPTSPRDDPAAVHDQARAPASARRATSTTAPLARRDARPRSASWPPPSA